MPQKASPCCPSCGKAVSLGKFWEVASTNRFGALWRPSGIACPHCFSPLRVTQGLMKVVTLVLIYLPAALFLLWHSRFGPSIELTGVVVIVGLIVLVPVSIVVPRRFARVRLAKPDEKLEYPLQQAFRQ